MLDIDKKIFDIITPLNGMYMRYSDDFIIVLPNLDSNSSFEIINNIISMFNDIEGLKLEPEKTQYYHYSNQSIRNCGILLNPNDSEIKKQIDFLGFTFDGKTINVRSKTISKYYYRMHKKAKTIVKNNGYTCKRNKISKRNLYEHYSIRGAYSRRGNFLTYIERSKRSFDNSESIEKITKNHMQKISKALKNYN